jgi:AraC family transcriptional regulator
MDRRVSEHDTVRNLIAWKVEQKLLDPTKYRAYGVHYTDPRTTLPSDHHVAFCLSIDRNIKPNAFGLVNKIIPQNRCALARDIGSRYNNRAAAYLYEEWLRGAGRHRAPSRFSFTTSMSARMSERKI